MRPLVALAVSNLVALAIGAYAGTDTLLALLLLDNAAFGLLLVVRVGRAFMHRRVHAAVQLGVFFGFAWYLLILSIGSAWLLAGHSPDAGWLAAGLVVLLAGHVGAFILDATSRRPDPMQVLGGAFVRLLVTLALAFVPFVLAAYAVKAFAELLATHRFGAALTT